MIDHGKIIFSRLKKIRTISSENQWVLSERMVIIRSNIERGKPMKIAIQDVKTRYHAKNGIVAPP